MFCFASFHLFLYSSSMCFKVRKDSKNWRRWPQGSEIVYILRTVIIVPSLLSARRYIGCFTHIIFYLYNKSDRWILFPHFKQRELIVREVKKFSMSWWIKEQEVNLSLSVKHMILTFKNNYTSYSLMNSCKNFWMQLHIKLILAHFFFYPFFLSCLLKHVWCVSGNFMHICAHTTI